MSDGWAVRVSRAVTPNDVTMEVWYVRMRVAKDAEVAVRALLNIDEKDDNVSVRAADQVPERTLKNMGLNDGGIRPM